MEKVTFHRGGVASGGQDHLMNGCSYEIIEDNNWSLVLKVGNHKYKADPDDLPCEQGTSISLEKMIEKAIITYSEKNEVFIYKIYSMELESCMILPLATAEKEMEHLKEMYPEGTHTLHIVE
jgi:hypothetical protein